MRKDYGFSGIENETLFVMVDVIRSFDYLNRFSDFPLKEDGQLVTIEQ